MRCLTLLLCFCFAACPHFYLFSTPFLCASSLRSSPSSHADLLKLTVFLHGKRVHSWTLSKSPLETSQLSWAPFPLTAAPHEDPAIQYPNKTPFASPKPTVPTLLPTFQPSSGPHLQHPVAAAARAAPSWGATWVSHWACSAPQASPWGPIIAPAAQEPPGFLPAFVLHSQESEGPNPHPRMTVCKEEPAASLTGSSWCSILGSTHPAAVGEHAVSAMPGTASHSPYYTHKSSRYVATEESS